MNIATMANGLKKPTNKTAFEIVKTLASLYPDSQQQIAELYRFFIPNVPTKPKTDEQWVNKAVAKNDVRTYLETVYSDGKRLIGTDGNRMHISNAIKLPVGYYDKAMQPIEVAERFPEVDRVIRKKSSHQTELKNIRTELVQWGGKNFAYELFTDHTKIGQVDKKIWDDIICFMNGCAQVHFNKFEHHDSIIIISGDLLAVLMQIRL